MVSENFVILIVDDNVNNRITLRALLQSLSEVDIIEADSGESALARTIEYDVHLILLDIQMPIMDGFETAKHLQMTERTRDIPIIFVTAVFKSEEFVRYGYKIGAIDYLTKPIDDNLLLNRVGLYQRLFQRQQVLKLTIDLLKKREQELIEARNIADAANRAKSIFLSNMSHELRTPLNAVLGFAQLLQQDKSLTEYQKSAINTINHAGQHLLSLINDILEISRIEAGRATLIEEPFDLVDMLKAVTDIIKVRADNKLLVFHLDYDHTLPRYVRGDVNRLRQVLINLLTNAVKFTDKGTVTLQLLVKEQQKIGFVIQDTGAGIEPEDVNCLFHPFYQGSLGLSKSEGSGLGLTISREFVRLMGSDITVATQLGIGSTFSFDLVLPTVSADNMLLLNKTILGLMPEEMPVRVLVAEDDEDNRQLISCLLDNAGFDVQTVSNGQQVIERFMQWHPQFIWMDMRMPIMDGYQATQYIRSLKEGGLVKIVAITASVFREDRNKILAIGCDDIVFKPLAQQHLLQIMGRLLNLHYRYADVEQKQAQLLEEPAVDFSLLPDSLRMELQIAAEQLDIEAIHLITETMLDYPDHVKQVELWMNNFRFDALLQVLRQDK